MVDNTARNMQRGPSFTNPGVDMAAIEQVRAQAYVGQLTRAPAVLEILQQGSWGSVPQEGNLH